MKDTGVKYFRFPKDEVLIRQWKNACRRADTINHKHAVICSDHFAADDYEDDMKSRLLNCEPSRNKRTLKKDAVPSLHLANGWYSFFNYNLSSFIFKFPRVVLSNILINNVTKLDN